MARPALADPRGRGARSGGGFELVTGVALGGAWGPRALGRVFEVKPIHETAASRRG